MRVALVHDDLVQWGGAERVLVGLSEIFPEAPIYTSVVDYNNTLISEQFKNKKIVTSFIQNIPGWKNLYKQILPLYPLAFEQFDFSKFDLVISQSTRFAKSIITKPNTKHISYCHTPPRFLWNYSGESYSKILDPYFSFLRIYDHLTSKRVDHFWAGSKNAQGRIWKNYQVKSDVLYPFVDIERFENIDSFDGGYLLVISRLNKYKRVDLVIKTALKLNLNLKIVGIGPEEQKLKEVSKNSPKIEFLGSLSEEILIKVLAGCKCLVVAGEEDFGLTSLEAQALGKPVLAFKSGGSLETVLDGETGFLFESQSVESLEEAIKRLDKTSINKQKCTQQAKRFSKTFFKNEVKKYISNL